MSKPILLFDGVCGLCDRLTQFLLKRDTHDRLLFASLQSEFAAAILNRHGKDTRDLDTVYVVKDFEQPNEILLSRSDAILYVLSQLGGVWSLSGAGKILPKWLRDRLYNLVARNRYKVFGKHETCMLPEPKHRRKFLDVTVTKAQ
jgi:predicted DCC family thiol-disulfide oxidoreductase YuxK